MKKLWVMWIVVMLTGTGAGWAGLISIPEDKYAVLSGGNLMTLPGVTIKGVVGSGGNIKLGWANNITGGVYTAGNLCVDHQGVITGGAVANGDMYLAHDVAAGSLDAGRNLTIEQQSVIHGDVSYGGNYWAHHSVSVEGSLDTMPDLWNQTVYMDIAPSSSSTQNLSYGHNSSITLTPGDYGNLSVDKDSTIYLSAGSYNFQNVWLDKSIRIVADSSEGDVFMNAASSFGTAKDVTFDLLGEGRGSITAGASLSLGQNNEIYANLNSLGNLAVGWESDIYGSLRAGGNIFLMQDVLVDGTAVINGAVPEPTAIVLLTMAMPLLFYRRHSVRKFRQS